MFLKGNSKKEKKWLYVVDLQVWEWNKDADGGEI